MTEFKTIVELLAVFVRRGLVSHSIFKPTFFCYTFVVVVVTSFSDFTEILTLIVLYISVFVSLILYIWID